MALELPHSVFVHIPRTGGTFTRLVILESEIVTREILGWGKGYRQKGLINHCRADAIPSCIIQDKLIWTNIREPIAYLRSRWGCPYEGRNDIGLCQYATDITTFTGFLEYYVSRNDDILMRRVNQFCSVDGKCVVDVFVKTEEVRTELPKLLYEHERIDVSGIAQNMPPQHVGKNNSKEVVPADLVRDVYKVEAEYVERFGYEPNHNEGIPVNA